MSNNYIGKVAMIPNSKTLIVTNEKGLNYVVGDEVEVYGKSVEIKDPDTDEILGEYIVVKETLKIAKSNTSFLTLNKIETVRKPRGLTPVVNMTGYYESEEIHDLNVNEKDNLMIEDTDRTISVGDKVNLI